MTSFRPVRRPHTRLPITRLSNRSGAFARIFPILAASLALAVGADSARATEPNVAAASDTLKVTLSAPDGGTVAEGETGHFRVSVAGSTASGAVTVRYSVSGTAVSGEDYTALSGTVTVAQGENYARIALEALDDGILDKGETVVLALTGATGPGTVIVDRTEATAEIADDGTVTIALAAVTDTIGEGSAWNSSVTMSTPVADRVRVRWWTSDGTAVAGRDYEAADEVLSFEPGETAKPVAVRTLKDSNTEPVETFYVSLGPPADQIQGASGGGLSFGPRASGFIECSVRFPQRGPIVYEYVGTVPSGTVIDTVAAETTPGIPYYELKGGDGKFTINSLTAEIKTTAALEPDLYELEVTVHDECSARASVDVNVRVKQPNRAPKPVGSIPDTTLKVGESATVDVSSKFDDPDDDPLTYTVESSDATTVGVSVDGSEVTYRGVAVGRATVTVTASDPGNLSAEQKFTVKVEKRNDAPEVEHPIDDLTLYVGKGATQEVIDLSEVFSDPNDDPLTYTVESSNADVATATVGGNTLTVTAKGKGKATVTVTASDGDLEAVDEFPVLVPNRAPEVNNEIADQTLHVGEGTNRKTFELTKGLSDPDGDVLSYTAVSSNPDVATATVSGSTLTVTAKGKGDATVTVTATDGDLEAEDAFKVDVPNRTPVVVNGISDLTLFVGDPPNESDIGISGVFRDPDGDVLRYTVESSNTGVATVTASGGTLTVTAEGKGKATVTVTASDGDLEAEDDFAVEVPNRTPTVANGIADLRCSWAIPRTNPTSASRACSAIPTGMCSATRSSPRTRMWRPPR
ncbi:MAG: Ig-like domain-containing protein [Gemmatimonadetes bacterium]|nr:Ig-like domain-containing protein [Gemmatimonadota bacterium]